MAIDDETARKLRRAAQRLERARKARDELILDVVDAKNATLREVGEAVGLSHTACKQIADRQRSHGTTGGDERGDEM